MHYVNESDESKLLIELSTIQLCCSQHRVHKLGSAQTWVFSNGYLYFVFCVLKKCVLCHFLCKYSSYIYI